MIISTILVILGILFMFLPFLLLNTVISNEDVLSLMYLTFPMGAVFIGIIGVVNTYKRNKKSDLVFDCKELKIEENTKSKYIKNEDKIFLIDHIDKFEEQIGNGKSYYINAFLKKKTPFNGGAFFGGLFWLGYRGLLKEFFTVLGIFIAFDITMLVLGMNTANFNFGMGVSMFCGTFGNNYYYSKLRKNIENETPPTNPIKGLVISIISFIIYLCFIGTIL